MFQATCTLVCAIRLSHTNLLTFQIILDICYRDKITGAIIFAAIVIWMN